MDRDGKEVEPRFWLNFTGKQLKEYFGKRALWYEGRALYLKEVSAKMPKPIQIDAVPEEAQQFYTGSTMAAAEKNVDDQAKQAERHARRFRLLEKHVDEQEVFALTENDVDRLELTNCM